MFGSNKHEGIYVADSLYRHFLRPNHLENDPEFLKYDLVPAMLDAMSRLLLLIEIF